MKTPEQIAKDLVAIYEQNFGGKGRGRYQISREKLRRLSARRNLQDVIIYEIINEAYEMGFIVTNMGDNFSVIEAAIMESYRNVPDRVIVNILD